jgi:dienelactone hydrolase
MLNFFIQKRDVAANWKIKSAIEFTIIGFSLLTGLCFAQNLTAQNLTLDARLDEQVVMVPASLSGSSVELETTVFKPPGQGPFPLVVMNHGKEPGNPHLQKRDRFLVISREFVKRGYAVVIPMRKGFAKSTGNYVEDGCNMEGNGRLQADDLQAALEYFLKQSWVDKDRILIAGQSYGGLATMAFGTRNFPGVKGLINFAGGLRADGGSCQWQSALVDAFADYGAKSTVPSLWFYGANDSYFGPDIAVRMLNAYVASGGNARLVAYGAFKRDAHAMAGSRDGVKIWWPETEKFLQQIGLPTQEVIALADDMAVPKSDFAAISNVDAIPYLRDTGREAYRVFLTKSSPKAFAVSPGGAWSWAEEGDDPVERVLADCQSSSRQPCKVYAVDNNVVWTGTPVAPSTATASSTAVAPSTALSAGK